MMKKLTVVAEGKYIDVLYEMIMMLERDGWFEIYHLKRGKVNNK